MIVYYNIYDILWNDGKYLEYILTNDNKWILSYKYLIVKNKMIYFYDDNYPLNELQIRLISAFQKKYGGFKYIYIDY